MKYDSTLSCMESLEDGMSWWTAVSFTEQQLRMVDAASMRQVEQQILCPYCGKKGHAKKDCWKWQRERGGKGDSKGKSKSDGKGKDGGKHSAGKGNEKGKHKGDGKGKDDGKGKKKKFKKDKRRRSRSASSDGSNVSTDGHRSAAGGSPSQGSVMMMRSWTGLSAGNRQSNASFEQPGVDLSSGLGSAPESSQGTRSVTQGVGSSVADVQRICSTLQVEPRDLWLVDSGATCHVLAASYASSFRIVRNHGVSPKLFNASSDEIAVEGLVDIELSFHGLEITLQEVIVAHVAFNALSPWAGAEHGWKTYLGKSGSRMFKGRKSIKLSAANRAWWAISGKKGKGSSRGKGESAPEPMELDSLPVCDSGSPAAGAPKKKPEALKSCLKTPNGSSDPGSSGESVMSAASSVPIGPRKRSSVGMSLQICDTPFAYMLRGMRSVACVTEEHEFFDCDQGFAEVFELDFPELCCGDHDFACSEGRMLAAPLGRTHDLCSRTHDLCDRTHDLCSRMHDLGSCRLSESVLCRMQVAISQCLKVARHGLKVAQRVLHVLCPDLRAGFCQALRFHSAEASELILESVAFLSMNDQQGFHLELLPKLLFLILLVLWGYDGPYGGGCYALGSVDFGCWNGGCRGWWNNNGFGRSMGAMGSYSPSHGSIGSPAPDAPATATVPSVTSNPDAPAITTVPSVTSNPDAPAITTVPSVSHNPDAPAITTLPSVSTAIDAPATSPVPLLVTMPAASSMGPPAVAVPQIKYAARPGEGRLLDYASSLRLVSMSAPRFRGGPYGTTTSSSAAASSGGPTNLGGPISVLAWDQFSTASSSGLSPQEYAALNRMPMGSSEPEVREWPKFLRVRVSGDLNYKGPDWQCCRAQRRLYSTGLSACPGSRGYSRPNGGWREIFAGVRKIAPIGARMGRSKAHCGGRISYTPILCQRPRCSYAVLTGGKCANGTGSSKHYGSWHIDQRLGAGSRQTFCNGPHWDYHPINGDRGLDASKLHPKPKRRDGCPSKDARGSPLDGVHKYVAALQRHASVSSGDAIESIGGRNRGGVQQLCCFEQYTCSIHRLFRLSGFIWGWSDQTTFIYPSIGTCASSTTTAYFGSRGTGSWPGATIGCCCYHYDGAGNYVSPRQCLGDRTAEVYWLAYATASGGGAFTLSGPGVSSACGGIVFERTNRTVFVAHIAPERANEVVYNPWIGCTGVVREAYQFVASQDSRTSAVIPHPANGGTSHRELLG